MTAQLLPPNRTKLEAVLADQADYPITKEIDALSTLADSTRCRDSFLPLLAWMWRMDTWLDSVVSTDQMRTLIRSSLVIHKQKGTVAAVKQLFRDLELGEVTLYEDSGSLSYDGQHSFKGWMHYGGDKQSWACYWVRLDKLLNVDQADFAKRLLNHIAPARCQLLGIDFSNASLLYNDMATFSGRYTYGVI